MARLRTGIVALTAAAAAFLPSACAGEDAAAPDTPAPTTTTTEPAPEPPPAPGEDCDDGLAGGEPLRLGPADALGAVAWGEGDRVVVLMHQSDGHLCQWVPYAAELAENGYRAIAVDAPYRASSRDADMDNHEAVLAAAEYARAQNPDAEITLLGASMGGTAVLVAAAALTPPPVRVIALSPPTYYDGRDALAAVPELAAPVLYVAGGKDGRYAENVHKLDDATPDDVGHEVLVVDSGAHGVDLLDPETGDAAGEVRAAVSDFLAGS